MNLAPPGTSETPDQVKWIKAKDALQRATKALGSRAVAKAELADLLRDGFIRTLATQMWESGASAISTTFRQPSAPEAIETNAEIPPLTWRRSRCWHEDISQWRWQAGNFVVTRRLSPLKRTVLRRVKFAAADIEKIFSSSPEKGPGGAPRRMDAWDAFWMEVVAIARAGRLTKGHLRSQTELRSELLDETQGALSDSSIKPVVRQIWHRFVEQPSKKRKRPR